MRLATAARTTLVLAVLAVLAGSAIARAQTKPSATPPPPPAAPAKSAIAFVAGEIAQALGQLAPGTLVVVSPLASDIPAPKADELAVRIGAVIAGRLGVTNAHPQPATLAVARGLPGRAGSLVFIQLEIAKGELRATADVYPVVSNGWERLRNPAPGPRAHAFAASPLDAEIRTFMTPILLEQAAVHRAKHEEQDVLAIGCGDVDLDGGLELVLVSRARVALAKFRTGKLVVTRAVPWGQIAPRLPTPMREPLASVIVSPRTHRGEIFIGSTERAGVAVDASLLPKRSLSGVPIPGSEGDACAIASPAQGTFEGDGVTCAPPAKGEPAVLVPKPAPRFDAVATLALVGKDGAPSSFVAAREPTGKLRLRRVDAQGKPVEATMENVGAQIALADLDLDGLPEIVTSADSGEDVVSVSTWNGAAFAPRLRLPAKEGVRAMAACPPEERGAPGVALVVGSEVWIVR